MENQIQFVYPVTDTLFKYLRGASLEQTIERLREIESIAARGGKTMWFRFFKDDTAATSIFDLEKDLRLPPNHPNYLYIMRNVQRAVDEGSVEVYVN